MREFTSAKRSKKVIEFTLDGETYHFTPQKSAVVFLALIEDDGPKGKTATDRERSEAFTEMRVTKANFDWLGEGLPPKELNRLIARLKDPKDDLDSDLIQEVISELRDEVTGRPTT